MARKTQKRVPFVLATLALLGQATLSRPAASIEIASAQESSGLGDARRDDPCDQLPAPPGKGQTTSKRCPALGSSSGIAKGDFNGDGVGDLAIGAPGEGVAVNKVNKAEAGAVHILYGTGATGLVATAPGVPNNQLLTQKKFSTNPDRLIETGDQFGATLAAGDFNNDGFSDLAVGIPGEATSSSQARGAVEVFYGSATGLGTSTDFFGPATFTPLANPANSTGATSLSWGDFNHDGLGDLAVASSFTSDFVVQTGAVTVLWGSSTARGGLGGLTTANKLLLQVAQITGQSPLTAPLVLTAGDFDGDLFSDLVAGSPLTDDTPSGVTKAGAVHVFYGVDNLATDTADFWMEGQSGVPGAPSGNGELFGASVAVGDFNGDGFADLGIGAPGEGGTGGVIIIYGSAFRLQPSQQAAPSQFFSQASLSASDGAESGDRFGAALAAGDFNNDGRKDLAIGSPGEDLNVTSSAPCGTLRTCTITTNVDSAGLVYVIFGSTSGLSTSAVRSPQVLNQATVSPTAPIQQIIESGDEFGSALTAWNFGVTAHADLAVGVPFEDFSSVQNVGAVHVVYGSNSGLAFGTSQVWTQDSAGIAEVAEAGDKFGQGVY